MHRASCLCGAVTWQVDGALELMSHCHCSRCRKVHGAEYGTYVAADAAAFRLDGEAAVARWEPAPGALRCFCRQCGSVTPSGASDGRVFAPAGNFLDDPGARPLAHIFVASKPPWVEIRDTLPRFDAYPEGFSAPALPPRPPLDPPGKPRGSCLCGAVAFVLEAPAATARHCHCGRCRRQRSATHATNVLTRADGVRVTRGADRLASYKLPEARYFMHVFCAECGSSLPRIDRERDLAVIPIGAFDDDPGIRPREHIFVASRAAWFPLPDDGLPRHDAGPPVIMPPPGG